MRRAASLLAAWVLAGCTSEAHLGYWGAAPLATQDAATMQPSVPPFMPSDAAIMDPPVSTPAGPPDGGFVHAYPLCLRNPSLDGIPAVSAIVPGTWWPADSWESCWNDPGDFPDPAIASVQVCAVTVANELSTVSARDGMPAQSGLLPAPTHGVSYLLFDNLRHFPERTSQQMCAPLEAGVTYNFAIDLASRAGQSHDGIVLGAGVLEIYASNFACTHAGEPLWRSPQLTAEWQTYCVSITPAERVTFMTLQMPSKDRARSAIMADNIRLAESCGPAVVLP